MTVDALFQQAGLIRAETVHELFDVAALLAGQPLPRGDRVAIVTNGGGPAILCADACQANGLDVVELPETVQRELVGFLAPEASLRNPVDMIATATAVLAALVIPGGCHEVAQPRAACGFPAGGGRLFHLMDGRRAG